MTGLVGLAALLIILGLSLVITRLATTALTLTGLSREAAKFQARSAFTGTGFTSDEAEKVVDHPARRRVIMLLMLIRSAGVISILMSLILSMGTGTDEGRLTRLLYLLAGVVVLWAVARSRAVERWMSRLMSRALARYTDLDTRDYSGLLDLSGRYAVMELQIQPDDWLDGRELSDARLPDEGVTVLGIYRQDGSYLGVPRGDTRPHAGDKLVLYGRGETLKQIDRRKQDVGGALSHQQAISEQKREERQLQKQEREAEAKRRLKARQERQQQQDREQQDQPSG